jgi:hypothetical protein
MSLIANVDFLSVNGSVKGQLVERLLKGGRLDAGMIRPYLETNKKSQYYGRTVISVYLGGNPADPKSYSVVPTTNAGTLRRDEWKQLDEALLPIAESRLGGVQDLIDKELTYDLGNAMGTTVLEYHNISDAMEADLTMDGVTRSMGDRPKFDTVYMPIPIIHVDYEINLRALEASRRLGNPLDTTDAERAARKCMEKLEQMLFTNTTYTFGGGTIYSYVNQPSRNTATLDAAWDDSSTTGSMIVDDVRELKQASIDAKRFGPWMLYIPATYETSLDADYDSTTPGTTVRERILKIDGIMGVKVVDTLANDNILLVQMNKDVVRLVRGMGLTNVEWPEEGGMVRKYKVMMIQVPQVRADQLGSCGIVHMS